MILDPEKAQERLNSPNNLANRLAEFRKQKQISTDENGVTLVNPGRQLPRLPNPIKEEIKEKALSGKYTQKEIAEEYGISAPAVGHLKRSAEKEAESKKEEQRNQFLESALKDTAAEKMLLAMGLITEEKLATLKARELAQISSALSAVYNSGSQKNSLSGQQINLVVYSPEIRSESSYRTVEIRNEN